MEQDFIDTSDERQAEIISRLHGASAPRVCAPSPVGWITVQDEKLLSEAAMLIEGLGQDLKDAVDQIDQLKGWQQVAEANAVTAQSHIARWHAAESALTETQAKLATFESLLPKSTGTLRAQLELVNLRKRCEAAERKVAELQDQEKGA